MKVKVTVITVVYGTRWPLLKQVADACLSDSQVITFVIVDNGCKDAEAMDEYVRQHGERVVILRQEKNIGYSGAINKGIVYAQETDCDFVFVLDDDSVPEEGAIDHFVTNLQFFKDRKVILVGNRVNVPGNKDIFTSRPLQDKPPRGTLFEVFSFRKLINAFKLILGIKPSTKNPFIPIVPTEAFVTGGTFLPIEVVREVEPPDASMFIYGEDLDYAWRIRKLGYQSYACARPIITDIDMTFPSYGYHIFGLFDPDTPTYKVYYRMRNAVRISKRHTDQWLIVLILNVVVWYVGLCLIGLIKWGPSRTYLGRAWLIARALYTGFVPETPMPKSVVTPK
ncbi:MAG: glycosyltransferase family 2 protein [Candidatus Paceibacterota bacterium]